MAIKKVVKSSVSQQVFDQLREQILSGSWKPGQKLPSENELAAQFGVSRVTVRNALQKLSGLGLLETRFGEGSFRAPSARSPAAGPPTGRSPGCGSWWIRWSGRWETWPPLPGWTAPSTSSWPS